MKQMFAGLLVWMFAGAALAMVLEPRAVVSSPDGRLAVTVILADGQASYTVAAGGREIIRKSQLGVVRDDADFTRDLGVTTNYLTRSAERATDEDRYELINSKRRANVYRANRLVFETR